MAPHTEERTLGQMFAELTRDTRTLVQQEVQLATTEITEKASKMATSVGFLVGGGVIAYGGLLAIIAAAVLGLIGLGVMPWVAALLGGLLAAVAGYFLIRVGLSRLRAQDLKPQQTIDTLKEDVQWLRTQTK